MYLVEVFFFEEASRREGHIFLGYVLFVITLEWMGGWKAHFNL